MANDQIRVVYVSFASRLTTDYRCDRALCMYLCTSIQSIHLIRASIRTSRLHAHSLVVETAYDWWTDYVNGNQ